jgi:hypothetical protein
MLKLHRILVWAGCVVALGCGSEQGGRDEAAGQGGAGGSGSPGDVDGDGYADSEEQRFGMVDTDMDGVLDWQDPDSHPPGAIPRSQMGAGGTGGGGAGVGGAGTGGAGGVGGDSCAAEGAEAEVGLQGADIVWVIDNSCSMAVEAAAVQANMNRFTTSLIDQGINVNMVLISSAMVAGMCDPSDWLCALSGGFNYGVCIGAPFGSGMCPMDSKPPNFLHLDLPVGSTNALQMVTDTYSQWSHMMRPGTSKHFAVVTDDDSDVDAATFTQRVNALDPAMFASWRYHGIFSFTACPDAASVGTVHQQLVTQTGGVAGDLCTQQFDPVFDLLAMDVAEKAEIACDWPIPAPPTGQTLDKNKVNVRYTRPDNTGVDVLRIPPGEDCGDREGWVYDNDELPSQVIACPASCDGFRATGGKVDVLFGCASVLVE